MVSLVTAMARNYYHFFDHDIWDEKKASQYFCGLSDLDRRKEYVRTVYEIVLGSDRVKEPVKILITETSGNKEQAALLYNRRHRRKGLRNHPRAASITWFSISARRLPILL